MPGRLFHELHALWRARERRDESVGTLVNAYLAAGGGASGCKAGESYMDLSTLHGYFSALLMQGDLAGENPVVDRASETSQPSSVPRPAQ